MFTPSKEVFRKKCKEGNLIPVTAEIMADLETPVSAFLKLGGGPYSFLLESVEGGGGSDRYSFLGTGPRTVFRAKGRHAAFLLCILVATPTPMVSSGNRSKSSFWIEKRIIFPLFFFPPNTLVRKCQSFGSIVWRPEPRSNEPIHRTTEPVLTGGTISLIVKPMEIKPHILVVDDEPGARQSLEVILEDNYEVLSAGSGQEALNTLQKIPVDLVLLDVNMPEMDGLETLRRIKEQDEEVDVIMVSALNLARKAVDAIKLGAYDYITKPYEREDILSTVARVMSKRNLHKELDFLRKEAALSHGFDQIISQNKRMLEIFHELGHH